MSTDIHMQIDSHLSLISTNVARAKIYLQSGDTDSVLHEVEEIQHEIRILQSHFPEIKEREMRRNQNILAGPMDRLP